MLSGSKAGKLLRSSELYLKLAEVPLEIRRASYHLGFSCFRKHFLEFALDRRNHIVYVSS